MKEIRIQAKVVKLESISDRIGYIKTGDEFVGYINEYPEIGQSFVLYNLNPNRLSEYIVLRTTVVKEIIDDRTFKTKNSIYKITTLQDERNDKLNTIMS